MSDNSDTMAMFCHACHNTWQQQAGAMECPACRSASTEIITPENDPRRFHSRQSPESNAPVEPQPTASADASSSSSADQEMRDAPPAPTTTQSQNRSNGTQTQAQGQEQTQPQHAPQPSFVFMFPQPAVTVFTTVVSDTHVPPPNAAGPRGPPVAHFGMNFFFPSMPHMPHVSAPAAPPPTGTSTPGQTDNNNNNNTQENARSEAQQQQEQQQHAARPPAGMPMGPVPLPVLGALLSSIFNPAAATFGDAVYSQEALDRIISQLREQSGQGGAPPASQAAIDKLEVRELDEKMLGGENKTRCVICVDEMSVGEKASVLPCTHFFHGECVTPWLKQHNTCPVCRRSVEPETAKVGKGAEFVEEEAAHHAGATAGCP